MGEELWVRPRAWRAAPQKVANRGIGARRSRGRERLLNDGQIQSPSVQSWLAARSQACWRGLGIFHPIKDPGFCRAVPNPNTAIRNFFHRRTLQVWGG